MRFVNDTKQKESKSKKRSPTTKLGLSSGRILPPSQFYQRSVRFDENKNINEDVLTPFDNPFYSLIRDDLWVLDPLSLSVLLLPSPHLLGRSNSRFAESSSRSSPPLP